MVSKVQDRCQAFSEGVDLALQPGIAPMLCPAHGNRRRLKEALGSPLFPSTILTPGAFGILLSANETQ